MFRNAFAAFATYDANRDGSIDFKELILAKALSEAKYVDSKLETFFKLLIDSVLWFDDNQLFFFRRLDVIYLAMDI